MPPEPSVPPLVVEPPAACDPDSPPSPPSPAEDVDDPPLVLVTPPVDLPPLPGDEPPFPALPLELIVPAPPSSTNSSRA
jgi:hypothetical protein